MTLVWVKVTPEKHEGYDKETQRNKVTPEKHEGYDKETQRNIYILLHIYILTILRFLV